VDSLLPVKARLHLLHPLRLSPQPVVRVSLMPVLTMQVAKLKTKLSKRELPTCKKPKELRLKASTEENTPTSCFG